MFSEHGLEKKILPFLMAIIVVITAVLLYLGHAQHIFVLSTLAEEEKNKNTRIYNQLIASLYEKYRMVGENMLLDSEVIQYVANRDHNRLLQLSTPLFTQLQRDNPSLEIMHFHTADNHSLLRLHRPDTYGDDLSNVRPMIRRANDTGKSQIGLEVGKYGVSYRIALPIREQRSNRHLGVLEFGINMTYVTAALKKQFDIDSAILFKTENLQTFFAYSKNADTFGRVGDMTIYTSTLKDILKDADMATVRESYDLQSYDGSERLIFQGAELTNFADRVIGRIILIKDMGYYIREIDTLRILSIVLAVFLLLISNIILHYSYHRFTRKIDLFQQRLLQKNKTLTKLSSIDHLTKANNRRKIEDVIYSEHKILKRYGRELSLILLDVDDFKMINDTYGHNVGDRVLRTLSKLLKSSIRESDFFGRWGGEEFMIVTPNTGAESAAFLAEKLRRITLLTAWTASRAVSA